MVFGGIEEWDGANGVAGCVKGHDARRENVCARAGRWRVVERAGVGWKALRWRARRTASARAPPVCRVHMSPLRVYASDINSDGRSMKR